MTLPRAKHKSACPGIFGRVRISVLFSVCAFLLFPVLAQAQAATVMTPDLVAVQMNGSLTCPPLRIAEDVVVCAFDDRTLKAVKADGTVLWSLTMNRVIAGPLVDSGGASVISPLSGGLIANVSYSGTLLWLRQFKASETGWVYSLTGGRPVLIAQSGKIHILNPDGSPLFDADTAFPISSRPVAGQAGIELGLSNGGHAVLDQDGRVSTSIPGSIPSAAPPQATPAQLSIDSSQSGNTYTMKIKSGSRSLEARGTGKVGHWLVDAKDGKLVAWGDSSWKLWIFFERKQGKSDSADSHIAPSVLFRDLGPAGDLELHYLSLLSGENDGPVKILAHIRTQVDASALAGHLRLYEDVLVSLLRNDFFGARSLGGAERVEAYSLLADFPSARSAGTIETLVTKETDVNAVLAGLAYFKRLGVDPEGSFPRLLDAILARWQDGTNGKWVTAAVEDLKSSIRSKEP